jgi:hypothetical protein
MRELHVQTTVISDMGFAPPLRRFTFTTHVTSSVGWIGAVLVFLALALIGLTSHDEQARRLSRHGPGPLVRSRAPRTRSTL